MPSSTSQLIVAGMVRTRMLERICICAAHRDEGDHGERCWPVAAWPSLVWKKRRLYIVLKLPNCVVAPFSKGRAKPENRQNSGHFFGTVFSGLMVSTCQQSGIFPIGWGMERDNQFIGQSGAFLDAVERASRAAPMRRPVLVIGERGTGKELIAERLHRLSNSLGRTAGHHELRRAARNADRGRTVRP